MHESVECPMMAEASSFGCGDDELDRAGAVRVIRHLHGCAACRAVAGDHHRITKLLRDTFPEFARAPASLTFESVLARVAELEGGPMPTDKRKAKCWTCGGSGGLKVWAQAYEHDESSGYENVPCPDCALRAAVAGAAGLHDTLARVHPSIERGRVWCRRCGATRKVDSAECLRSGWPLCCGETMTIDAPEEAAMPETPADHIECARCKRRVAVVDGAAVEAMWVLIEGLTSTILCQGCGGEDTKGDNDADVH